MYVYRNERMNDKQICNCRTQIFLFDGVLHIDIFVCSVFRLRAHTFAQPG